MLIVVSFVVLSGLLCFCSFMLFGFCCCPLLSVACFLFIIDCWCLLIVCCLFLLIMLGFEKSPVDQPAGP